MTLTRLFNVPNSLPCLPFGRVKQAKQYRKHSTQAARLGTLPVLEGYFQPGTMKPEPNLPISLSWGTVDLAETPLPMLSFMLQIGADVMYWLANPLDPEVWAMIDAWAAAGSMAFAANFPNSVLFASAGFELQPDARELRTQALAAMKMPSRKGFAETALGLFLSGRIERGTASHIASVPSVRHVQACTVQTLATGAVLVPHQGMVTSACGCLYLRPLLDSQVF
ncbi:hypothetical protein ACQ858_22075 [Variovorax ureilyticus]|uniref:hypothetical protein n=1 Tax=Variovorax ureilyticus TaxID=1836198 RepID=UPI003D675B0C